MVRTRAENTGRRAAGAKAPRKQLGGGSSSSSELGSPGGKDKHAGGNPVKWTQTPSWQKGIGSFFGKPENISAGENSISTGDDTMANGNSSTSNHTEKECLTHVEEVTQAE